MDFDGIITLAHGSGGFDSADLMQAVFAKHFRNDILARLEDAAVVNIGAQRLAISTDSFVVEPLIFPGGDIGRLAVCGTVNDVLMSGAAPKYLTCGFILEAGLSISLLDSICASLAEVAMDAGVAIICGDTKVIEGKNPSGGLMINTTGIGVFDAEDDAASVASPSPAGLHAGDSLIVSGALGDHHAAILSARMGIENEIQSDCTLLTPVIEALAAAGVHVHAMRDVTRGGLATVLNELAAASGVSIELTEGTAPIHPPVKALCGILGLDPLYMGNEGKMVFSIAPEDESAALAAVRATEIGREAAAIGRVLSRNRRSDETLIEPQVFLRTAIGGTRRIDALYGEGLPRIC
ncbi:hydrogenase expression/formation protein HypE [Clostridia bacterium]|nr:hydrogenase expression/formation protein HypE [Clostridia bacterium]